MVAHVGEILNVNLIIVYQEVIVLVVMLLCFQELVENVFMIQIVVVVNIVMIFIVLNIYLGLFAVLIVIVNQEIVLNLVIRVVFFLGVKVMEELAEKQTVFQLGLGWFGLTT